jgi:type IV secretion system protein VirB10
MLKRLVALSLVVAFWCGQLPLDAAQQPAASPAPVHRLTVPAGTVVQLNLVSPILSKSSKPGDTVRAAVAFPVTVQGQLAIPAGSFVEGQIAKIFDVDKHGHRKVNLQLHFTRLLFASGYALPLDAVNSEEMAGLQIPGLDRQTLASLTGSMPLAMIGMGQTVQPQNPGMPGPDPKILIPAILGGFAALVTGMLLVAHHSARNYENNNDFTVQEAGWQFQMSLSAPLVLDADQAAAAASQAAKK